MKNKILIVTAALALFLFGGAAAVFAQQQGWLNFTGDSDIEQADADVNEIMDIMKNLHNRNITLEQALNELEDLNPAGLAKQNKELREQVKQLASDFDNQKQAYTDLQTEHTQKVEEIENLQYQISEKNSAYEALQQERDGLQSVIDDLNAQLSTLNYANNENTAYIEHLEAELKRANEQAASHSSNTSKAVEQAREYQNYEE